MVAQSSIEFTGWLYLSLFTRLGRREIKEANRKWDKIEKQRIQRSSIYSGHLLDHVSYITCRHLHRSTLESRKKNKRNFHFQAQTYGEAQTCYLQVTFCFGKSIIANAILLDLSSISKQPNLNIHKLWRSNKLLIFIYVH